MQINHAPMTGKEFKAFCQLLAQMPPGRPLYMPWAVLQKMRIEYARRGLAFPANIKAEPIRDVIHSNLDGAA